MCVRACVYVCEYEIHVSCLHHEDPIGKALPLMSMIGRGFAPKSAHTKDLYQNGTDCPSALHTDRQIQLFNQ